MAYVYRHIRCDKNVPFYIGIGSQDNYSRAFTKANRNKYWHHIVNKSGYAVEIIIDGISWEDAKIKEIEFISLYKRKEHGGILCNLTDGGGGSVGLITSDEARLKQSLKKIGKPPPNKGKPMPKSQLEALIKSRKGVQAWNKGKKYSKERCERMSISRKGKPGKNKGCKFSLEVCAKLSLQRKGRVPPNKGKKMTEEQRLRNKYSKPRKGVLQFDLQGVFIAEHYSLADAAAAMNCSKQNIFEACKDGTKTAKGFVWKYIKTEKPPNVSEV